MIKLAWYLHSQVLPERVVRLLHSPDWKDREQALTSAGRALVAAATAASLPGASSDVKQTAESTFAAACEILSVTLK
jgi:hypothetical protein